MPKIIAMVVGLAVVIGVCTGVFKIAKDGWQRGMDAEARRRGLDPKIFFGTVEISRRDEVWNVEPEWNDQLTNEIALGSCRYRRPAGFQVEDVSEPAKQIYSVFCYGEADDAGKRDSMAFTVNRAPEHPTSDAGMEKLIKIMLAKDAAAMTVASGPIYERGTLNGKRCIRARIEGYDRGLRKESVNIHYAVVHDGVTAKVQMNLTGPVTAERLELLENAARSVRFD